jgi:hypothetical protein
MALRLSTGLRNLMMTATAGKSFAEAMQDGTLHIYSGAQPTTADDAETGTLLARITLASGAFTSGVATNGLEFGDAAGGSVGKKSGEVWSGVAIATGTAGWFRFYANTVGTGASSTAVRFDGSCGTSGAQCNMGSTTITLDGTVTIDTVNVTLPAS